MSNDYNTLGLEDLLNFLSKKIKKNIIMHLFTCHETECDVMMIVNALNAKQANISKHLNDLKKANIIAANKQGLYSYYYLTSEFLKKYKPLLKAIYLIDKERIYECECIRDGHQHEY
ncbi:transcriptional regulator [Mycoplasmopsis bovirhinis]|uniref:ArsR/SmtB family transcription factor n=1 Tax=Mycoplasmopsis bovirhinis TaxID=29553 RepID=UPI000C05AC85|nr:ArsR family transcriptional regulator [Mycoplasmopsis bovirhinis]ATO31158.1 transcriptional regulator [Mycoplasmopsis bovirhinis]